MKKFISIKFVLYIIAVVLVMIGYSALSDSPRDYNVDAKLYPNKSIGDYARDFVDNEIAILEDLRFSGKEFQIVESKIIKLEMDESFDDILDEVIEIWSLEYRLKANDMSKLVMAGGMSEEDGWITESTSMGKPKLVFSRRGERVKFLGSFYPQEFGFDTRAKKEMNLRIMLESNGILPNETYGGDHVIINFPMSNGDISHLLLSQPVKKGEDSIWVVERWSDASANIYYEFPDTNTSIKEEYERLQEQFESGKKPYLNDSVYVGKKFIKEKLGQAQVNDRELIIKDPASLDDFLVLIKK